MKRTSATIKIKESPQERRKELAENINHARK